MFYNRIHILFIIVVGFWVWTPIGHSQCSIDNSVTITDIRNNKSDTTISIILVDGATINDLNAVNQGVCGVTLEFTHPFMKELAIELISPAGQIVRLVGGNIVPTNTPFINWNVTFVPCFSTANPDPGFDAVWENDQLWQSFTNYAGQYYPHSGCLEDFDIGEVNGSWAIRCIDFQDGGVGRLLNASIIFCDNSGINCTTCEKDAGTFNITSLESCQGDTSLNNPFTKTYTTFPPDSTQYAYTNIVFSNQNVWEYNDNPIPSQWPNGEYTLCGLQYAKVDSFNIPPINTSLDEVQMRQYFLDFGICATLSTNCVNIKINRTTPPVFLDTVICKGTAIDIGGQILTTKGTFDILIPNGSCDSLVIVTVQIQNFDIEIQADKTEISCSDTELTLSGQNLDTLAQNLTYRWQTSGGNIVSDNTNSTITLNSDGVYSLIMTAEFGAITCSDTAQITILKDETFPVLALSTDTITCSRSSVNVIINSSLPLQNNNVWRAQNSSTFTENPMGITTSSSDMFYVTVTAINDCSVTDSIFVPIDTSFTEFTLSADTLSCIKDSVQIMMMPNLDNNYSFNWLNVDALYSNVAQPWVFVPINYLLSVQNTNNGCEKSFTLQVRENKEKPKIENFQVDTITCDKPIVTPIFMTNGPLSEYTWSSPGFLSNEISPEISLAGQYELTVISAINGCDTSFLFQVFEDNTPLEIEVKSDSLTCIVDTLELFLNINNPYRSITWTGPNGFSSSEKNPKAYDEGTYTVQVIGQNGCVTQQSIEITKSFDLPFVTWVTDSLTCDVDSIQLRITQQNGSYSYLWQGPGIIDINASEPFVTLPGLYTTTVTDIQTGCEEEFEFNLPNFRIFTDAILNIPVFKCTDDSVQVIISNNDLRSIVYTKDGIQITDSSPFLKEAGRYIYTFTNTYGCTKIDSFDLSRDDAIPEIFLVFDSIRCFQDSILVKATSDIAIDRFEWTQMGGDRKTGTEVYWYEGGEYSITAIGQNQCRNTQQFTIEYDTIAPRFTIQPFPTLTCKDSVFFMNIATSNIYKNIIWMPNNFSADSLRISAPGIYTATMVGLNDCETQVEALVIEDKEYPLFDVSASIINCRDQISRIRLTPLNDFEEIRWDNSRNPIDNANNATMVSTSFDGTYYFEIENEEGCISFGDIEVMSDIEKPAITDSLAEIITCNNPCASLKISSSDSIIRYLWNGPELEDFNGTDSICVNVPGDYFLQVTGANFCIENVTFSVEIDDQTPIVTTYTDTLTCEKGKVTIGVESTATDLFYEWNGPDFLVENDDEQIVTVPGIYNVKAIAPNGCFSEKIITVEGDFEKPIILIDSIIILPCDSSRITLSVVSEKPLFRYRWNLPDGQILNNSTVLTNVLGDYSVQASGPNGCLSDSIFFKIIPDNGDLGLSFATDTVTCIQKNVPLNIFSSRPNVSFTITAPDNATLREANNLVSLDGRYLVIARDINGCIDSIEITVPIDTLHPTIILDSMGQILCSSRSVILNGNGSTQGNSIETSWQGNPINFVKLSDYAIEVNEPGDYVFTIINNNNGCVTTRQFTVEETPSPFNSLGEVIVPPLCDQSPTGTIFLQDMNGSAPYVVFIGDKNVGSQNVFSDLKPGIYSFEVIDDKGCTFEIDLEIPAPPQFDLNLPTVINVAFGDSVTLSPQFNSSIPSNAIINWYQKDILLCENCPEFTFLPTQNSYYQVEFSIEGQCKEEAEVLIQVNRQMFNAIPNIFKPNSNSGNNLFYIPQTRGIESIQHIYVFDRWAENVFKAENVLPGDMSWGWDGTFKGRDCQPGVYIVIAEWKLVDGTIIKYKGDVTLVR